MNRRLMKAGEKDYLKESNGTKANCNTNVMQVWKWRIYISYVAVTQDASLRTTQLPCLYVLRLGLFPHRLWKNSASCSRLSLKRLCRLFCASLIRYFLLPSSSWAVSGPWLTSISSCFLLARNLFFNLKRTTFLQYIVNSGRQVLSLL